MRAGEAKPVTVPRMNRRLGRTGRRRAALVGALGWLALVSCAVGPERPAAPVGSVSTIAVAVEFVSVLVQLDGYSPYDTTIQYNPPATELGRSLVEVLELAGYGLQGVSDDQGNHYLGYSVAARDTETGRRTTIRMRVGSLGIARRFGTSDGVYVPTAPIVVRGAAPQPVALVGSVYVHRPDAPLRYPSGVRFLDDRAEGDARDDGTEAGEAGFDEADVDDPERIVSEVRYDYVYRPTGAARTAPDAPSLDPLRFVSQATARLYAGGRLAFALRPPGDFDARQALVLHFPTASDTLLGADNQRALERLVRLYDAATDRLSIASCDAGTARTDVPAARSERVKTELLTLGVPGDQLVEPGCPGAAAERAVTVTVERLRAG